MSVSNGTLLQSLHWIVAMRIHATSHVHRNIFSSLSRPQLCSILDTALQENEQVPQQQK